MLKETAQAPTNLTFGQLVRGDVIEARKETKKLIIYKASGKVAAIDTTVSTRRLRLVEVKVVNRETLILFDAGSIPNMLSSHVCGELGPEVKDSKTKITLANGSTTLVAGVAKLFELHLTQSRRDWNF